MSINTLIIQEGYSGTTPLFENSTTVLNLDLAETVLASIEGRLEKNKSMDMAFGIKNDDSTKLRMLMVELKFNLKDFYSLKKIDLEEKVLGSSLILKDDPPIYKLYIFIFNPEYLQEAISRLYRMAPRINSNYVAMDIELLKERYF